jgi:hypothetical protein
MASTAFSASASTRQKNWTFIAIQSLDEAFAHSRTTGTYSIPSDSLF